MQMQLIDAADRPNQQQYTLEPVAHDPLRISILSQIDPVDDLLHQFPDLLQPMSAAVKPVKHSIVHHIHTTGPPVRSRPRRYSPETMEILKKEIDSLLEREIIRYSDSPYGSPALLVPKGSSGNKYRLVIDYKLVNKQTTDSCYPLPFLHSCADVLYGKTVFSKYM